VEKVLFPYFLSTKTFLMQEKYKLLIYIFWFLLGRTENYKVIAFSLHVVFFNKFEIFFKGFCLLFL